MQRFIDAVGWLIEAVGRYPAESELGLAYYHAIEFPRDMAATRLTGADAAGCDALRLAS